MWMKSLNIFEYECENLSRYDNIDKYKLTARPFSNEPKWDFMDHLLFKLTNKGRSLTLEIEDFVEKYFDDDESKFITKKAVSKQNQKYDYRVFEDMNDELVIKLLESEDFKRDSKGNILIGIDGTKSEIPNTPETKEWAEIKETEFTGRKPARTLCSTATSLTNGFVLDANMGKSNSNEREMLKEHILKLSKFPNFKDFIIILDAGYYSLELKIFLDEIGARYVFRLSPTTYDKEISEMTTMDEILQIKNKSSRRISIKDENILEIAKKLLHIETRIVNIPIINIKNETGELRLLNNLSTEEYGTLEIGELYRQRWEIEVNYDRLKNKADLENYSGKLELTIKQDFHAKIYIFNLAMILRNNIRKHLERKNEKKREEKGKEDRTNINTLMGRVRNKILELFTSSTQKIKTIYNRIIHRGIKDTYLHDLNRPRIIWHEKRFIGKFRYNQRRNV